MPQHVHVDELTNFSNFVTLSPFLSLALFHLSLQASNPLYKQPISSHPIETDFIMYGKSYNGAAHWPPPHGGAGGAGARQDRSK